MANPDLVKQFGGKLVGIYTGAVLTKLIEIGYQLGLFEASNAGPATSEERATRPHPYERLIAMHLLHLRQKGDESERIAGR